MKNKKVERKWFSLPVFQYFKNLRLKLNYGTRDSAYYFIYLKFTFKVYISSSTLFLLIFYPYYHYFALTMGNIVAMKKAGKQIPYKLARFL